METLAENELRDRIVQQAFGCREALEVYALGMLRDRGAAEDAVQDALLVVMENYSAFEEGTSMMAWTRAIVRRKVLQQLDSRKRRSSLQDRLLRDAVDAALEEGASDDWAAEVGGRRHRLEHCLDKVSDRSRKLLGCVYGSGMSYADAAEASGMKIEAVRKNLHRTKGQLRSCLQRSTHLKK